MYREQPWSLKDRTKISMKKVTSAPKSSGIDFTEDIAVSTVKVLDLFEKDKEKYYSNQDISVELGISTGTISMITNRLEALRKIKIVKVRQTVSALSQVFQHCEGSMVSVEKEKRKKDTILLVKELFETNKNLVLTKKSVMEKIPGQSKRQVEESIRILLLDGTIKILDDFEDRVLKYQHSSGKGKGLKVFTEHDPRYTTISCFIKNNNFKGDVNEFKKILPNRCRAFYSSKGIIIEYLISDLHKCEEKIMKKNSRKRFGGNKLW